MTKSRILQSVVLCMFVFASTSSLAVPDMKGSKDHPSIPRIKDAVIYGYLFGEYDQGSFVTDFGQGQLEQNKVEGKRTRILYVVPLSVSLFQVLKNYEVALKELGGAEEMYRCSTDCASNLAHEFVWSSPQRIPNNLTSGNWLYQGSAGTQYWPIDQAYAYWTVATSTSKLHVSVYTSHPRGSGGSGSRGERMIHLEVVEQEDFKPTRDVTTADEISSGIQETGRIAL